MLETRKESSSKDEPPASLLDTSRRVFPSFFKSERTTRERSPTKSAPVKNASARREGKKTLRLKRWLVEQRQLTGEGPSSCNDNAKPVNDHAGTPAHAFLAYPHLGRRSLPIDEMEDVCARDYVIVEEDDLRDSTTEPTSSESTKAQTIPEIPPTPTTPKPKPRASTLASRIPRPQSVPPGMSWKNFPFAVSLSRRPSVPAMTEDVPSVPSLKPKKSNILRRSPLPQSFRVDPDATTEQVNCEKREMSEGRNSQSPEATGTVRTVRLKSKSTLRDLRLLSSTSKTTSNPRHSVASSNVSDPSAMAAELTVDVDLPSSRMNTTRSRFSNGFPRHSHEPSDHSLEGSNNSRLTSPSKHSLVSAATVASRSSFFSSTYTFSSPSQQSVATTSMLGFSSSKIPSRSGKSNNAIFREKSNNISTSMLSTSSRSAVFGSGVKRKTLVVSGIERNNFAALEGLRVWCESFGELRQITRVPNGDLHVDFKRADVADTVCRISAQVYIEGVGSVSVSWYTGKRQW